MPTPLLARILGPLLVAAGLAGCTSPAPPHTPRPSAPAISVPPTAPAATPPATPPAPPAPPPELATEARWLHEWFDGTPVSVALDEQGQVRLNVPAAYAFNPGASAPKPPLRAVLDRVAQSLGRHPNAKVLVEVPPGGAARDAAVRSHLQKLGMSGWRVSVQAGREASTNLVLSPGQAPVRQLDDDKLPLPPPAKPVKPAPPRAAASR